MKNIIVMLALLLTPLIVFSQNVSSVASASSSSSSSSSSAVSSVSLTAAEFTNEQDLLTEKARQASIKKHIQKYHDKGDPNALKLASIEVDYQIEDLDKVVERDGLRFSSKDREDFPAALKCLDYDKRMLSLCIRPEFFKPAARVYFDGGNDQAGKVDIFNNGGLNPSVDFAAIYIPQRFGHSKFFDSWSWGPLVAVGMTSPAKDSKDGTEKSSDAPVVIISAGLKLEYKTDAKGSSLGFEIGKAKGYSSDESFADRSDKSTYVGLTLNIK